MHRTCASRTVAVVAAVALTDIAGAAAAIRVARCVRHPVEPAVRLCFRQVSPLPSLKSAGDRASRRYWPVVLDVSSGGLEIGRRAQIVCLNGGGRSSG